MSWAITEKGYSQRRACALVGIDPRVYRYRSTRGCDETLRRRLRELGVPEEVVLGQRLFDELGIPLPGYHAIDSREDLAAAAAARTHRMLVSTGCSTRRAPPRKRPGHREPMGRSIWSSRSLPAIRRPEPAGSVST